MSENFLFLALFRLINPCEMKPGRNDWISFMCWKLFCNAFSANKLHEEWKLVCGCVGIHTYNMMPRKEKQKLIRKEGCDVAPRKTSLGGRKNFLSWWDFLCRPETFWLKSGWMCVCRILIFYLSKSVCQFLKFALKLNELRKSQFWNYGANVLSLNR